MNSLVTTKHATTRLAQRGFRMSDVELITLLGTDTGDGYIMREKDSREIEHSLKELLQRVRHIRNRRLVVVNGALVTAYRASKRERRRLFQRTYEADFD